MRTRNLLRSLATLAVVALALLALPAAAQQADFTSFVVLGDSTAFGTLDGCMVEYGQRDAFGAILARQAKATFEEPLLGKPGRGVILPGCAYLTSLAPTFGYRPSTGTPLNATLTRPYNNLAVDGFEMGDIVDTNSSPTDSDQRAYLVLRGKGTAIQQAAVLHPTFVIVSAGGNDLLGAVFYATPIDGVTMTPLPVFEAKTKQVVDGLKAAQGGTAKGFFVSLPISLPFVDTVSPILGVYPPGTPLAGQPIYALYDAHSKGGCPGGLPACPVPAGSKLTLLAAQLLQQGYGIPCAILPPTDPRQANCNKPLPDDLSVDPSTGAITPGVVLTKEEYAVISQRVRDLNGIISAQASAGGYKFFDAGPLGTELATTGVTFGGLTVTSAFLTGGFYSYDGIHRSSLGQAIMADEMVKFINATWGNTLPEVNMYPYIFNGNTSPGGYPSGAAMAPLTNEEMVEWAAAIYSPGNWENGLKEMFPLQRPERRAVGDPHGMPVSPGREVSGDKSERIH